MKIRMRSTLLVLALSVLFSPLLPEANAREWTSTDGKKMKALFLGIEDGKFHFKMANGQKALVPSERFIKADMEAAKRLSLIGDDSYTIASANRIDGLLAAQLKKNASLHSISHSQMIFSCADLSGYHRRIPTREDSAE